MPYVPWRTLREATLKVQWNGRNIAEVLQMTVDEASEFFEVKMRWQGHCCC